MFKDKNEMRHGQGNVDSNECSGGLPTELKYRNIQPGVEMILRYLEMNRGKITYIERVVKAREKEVCGRRILEAWEEITTKEKLNEIPPCSGEGRVTEEERRKEILSVTTEDIGTTKGYTALLSSLLTLPLLTLPYCHHY